MNADCGSSSRGMLLMSSVSIEFCDQLSLIRLIFLCIWPFFFCAQLKSAPKLGEWFNDWHKFYGSWLLLRKVQEKKKMVHMIKSQRVGLSLELWISGCLDPSPALTAITEEEASLFLFTRSMARAARWILLPGKREEEVTGAWVEAALLLQFFNFTAFSLHILKCSSGMSTAVLPQSLHTHLPNRWLKPSEEGPRK